MSRLFTMLILVITTHFTQAGLNKDQLLSIDGLERSYDIFIPTHTGDGARPLVVLLHGHFGSSDVMTGENRKNAPYKIWLTIAERESWYLVIPDGERGFDDKRGWNDCRKDAETNPSSNDVKFVNALVRKVSAQYPIDKNRSYAHGTSNGGNMALRLAQESGDKFKAVAAVVASMPKTNKCKTPVHPISVLVMNGTMDPLLPYDGGKVGRRNADKYARGSVMSTDETIQYWLTNNKISSGPSKVAFPNINKRDKSSVEMFRYVNDENKTEVVLYKIINGGHTEPSLVEHYSRLYKIIVGQQNRDIEMAEEVWKFFDRIQ